MSLHLTTAGTGPRLVLLHGWGLNSHVWDGVTPRFAERYTVQCVDLPGHGSSPWNGGFDDLETLAEALARWVVEPCFLLGWSLGGMAALKLAARFPQRIERLILVASTARFVNDDQWRHGVEPAVLDDFATRLASDYRATVREFLALQVQGDERATATLRSLRSSVLAHGEPQPPALRAGLEVLRHADLRADLAQIAVPTLVIAGGRDRLTPPQAGMALAAGLPLARCHVIERAAHAPFLSHAEEFCAEIEGWLAPGRSP